jgi:hypothetical protein
MNEDNFTVIDDGRISQVAATVDHAGVRLSPAALRAALGWEVKPQGLCKDDRCEPTSGHPELVSADGIDLAHFAQLLSRPIAMDPEERVAYIGVAAADRAAQLTSLEAPDFTLPDLDGTLHSLSDYGGRKVLLVAYASW